MKISRTLHAHLSRPLRVWATDLHSRLRCQWASRHMCTKDIFQVSGNPALHIYCMSQLWPRSVQGWEHYFCTRHLWQFQCFCAWLSPKIWTQRRLGWERHYYFANKAVLLQSYSRYFSARCLPLLRAVHMPPLIPHRPRGRLGDYLCGSWETQNAGRRILLWLSATDPPEPLRLSSASTNRWPRWPQTSPPMFLHPQQFSTRKRAKTLS